MDRLTRRAFVVILLAATAPTWAWTMFYDGFDYYINPSADTTGYKLTPGSPGWWDYNIGETRYYNNVDTPRILPLDYKYAPSTWVTSNSDYAYGYWPFVSPGVGADITGGGFSYPGMPASTGHVVVCYGSDHNNGHCSRVSPIDLKQSPPTGPFRRITRGTVYYSLLMKVIEVPVPSGGLLGGGDFHAGFNNEYANGNLPTATTPTPGLNIGVARLYLRSASTTQTNKFQIGLAGQAVGATWDTNNTYTSGVGMTPMLVVGSYEFKDGPGNDVSSLWVNPAQSTLGGASAPTYTTNGTAFPLTVTNTDIQDGEIRSFFLRMGMKPGGLAGAVTRVVFDEVRIGTSWADVTSNVPCTPPTIATCSASTGAAGTQVNGATIMGSNFVANVTDVRLSMTGQPSIVATNVNVTSPTTLTCDFILPGTAVAGVRDVVVTTCTESPATLAGAFTVTCPAPTVTAIGMNSGLAGVTLTNVTVAGTNFVSGSTSIRLTMPGQPDINATNVSVLGPNSLTCTLALPADAAAGLRSVVVTTCGTATLADTFNVRRCGDPRFDGDNDGDVDMADFAVLQRCLTAGTDGSFDQSQCYCMSAGGNDQIDIDELTAFSNCASGALVTPNAACDDALPPP